MLYLCQRITNELLELMKRNLLMLVCCCAAMVCMVAQPRYQKDRMKLERLDRGLVAVRSGEQVVVSWRTLSTDNPWSYGQENYTITGTFQKTDEASAFSAILTYTDQTGIEALPQRESGEGASWYNLGGQPAKALPKRGIPYSTLKEAIASSEQAQLEWDLCVELERCNPFIDVIGATFGLSSEQIDQMFKYANGEADSLEVE